jgi:hypothetical protein
MLQPLFHFLFLLSPDIDKNGKSEAEVFGDEARCLQLIDFGRSIDMRILPEGTRFRYVSSSPDYCCPEMLDKRPWNFHIDYYGVACAVFTLLFGKHMKIEKGSGGKWVPVGAAFRR